MRLVLKGESNENMAKRIVIMRLFYRNPPLKRGGPRDRPYDIEFLKSEFDKKYKLEEILEWEEFPDDTAGDRYLKIAVKAKEEWMTYDNTQTHAPLEYNIDMVNTLEAIQAQFDILQMTGCKRGGCGSADEEEKQEANSLLDDTILVHCNQPSNCTICKESLDEKVSLIDDRLFHPACFKCSKCENILDREYAGSIDEPYCVKCYTNFCMKCDGCNEPFKDGKCFMLLDQRYHRECMKCAGCGKDFKHDQYFPFENHACCMDCYLMHRMEEQTEDNAEL